MQGERQAASRAVEREDERLFEGNCDVVQHTEEPDDALCKTYVRNACDRIRDADRHHRQDTGPYEYEHDTALCEDFGGEYQSRDEKNRRDAVGIV